MGRSRAGLRLRLGLERGVALDDVQLRRERDRFQGRDGDAVDLRHLVERDPLGIAAKPIATTAAAGGLDQARARKSE